MRQFNLHIGPDEDIEGLLAEGPLSQALAEARSVLAQVYATSGCSTSIRSFRALEGLLSRSCPKSVVIGTCAEGQILNGSILTEGTGVLISCFDSTILVPLKAKVRAGREAEAGRELSASLASCRELKAALLLAPLLNIDASAFLSGLRETEASLPLFGGGGGREPSGTSSIFLNGEVLSQSVACVALCGEELQLKIENLFEWKPLGPEISLDLVEGGRIKRIDGLPAFDFYRKRLSVTREEDIFLLEFPLLIERGKALLARNPVTVEPRGEVRIGADAFSGEKARLGYLDINALSVRIAAAEDSLSAFCPEAIFLYSCVCRHFTLQDENEMEILPFQALAPTAGVFTFGEFCQTSEGPQLQNSSEVVVALREGPPEPRPREAGEPAFLDLRRERHIRFTSHVFGFIGALTERIEAANAVLSARNEELKSANAKLQAEIAERLKAEERAEAAAAEKATLLRELQHRVKNSMAIIASLAGIEALRSEGKEAKEALEKLKSRVLALGSLYDMLYASGDISEVGLDDYLRGVVQAAAEGLGADSRGIALDCSIERVAMDLKRAISLGLIVNELVTDSLKYAFPGGRKGRIGVSLTREGPDLLLLVEDDGVGLPPELDPAEAKGFGLVIVESLAEQLRASFSARTEDGAKFLLRIPL